MSPKLKRPVHQHALTTTISQRIHRQSFDHPQGFILLAVFGKKEDPVTSLPQSAHVFRFQEDLRRVRVGRAEGHSRHPPVEQQDLFVRVKSDR